jgi:hypothetical protein
VDQGAGAENGAANPDMGSTLGDGFLVVAAHAHGKPGQAIGACQIAQQAEMFRSRIVEGRNAHQAFGAQAMNEAQALEKGMQFSGCDSSFLWFIACIDLDKQFGWSALFPHFW